MMSDPNTQTYFPTYGANQQQLFSDFTTAYTKLGELGTDIVPFVDQSAQSTQVRTTPYWPSPILLCAPILRH